MLAYLEFEVSLIEIEPCIWRRFQLESAATLGDLHLAIQASFEWDGDHMWQFHTTGRNRRTLAGPGASELGYVSDEIPDAWSVNLTEHFRRVSMTCRYTYDFGDCWVHAVKLRRRTASTERFWRRLVAGGRAAPKEDSGGVSGYWQMVEFAETGTDPWGDAEALRWIGDWRPDQFDLEAARAAFDQQDESNPP